MCEWIVLQDLCQVVQGAPLSRLRDERGYPYGIIQVRNLNTLEPDDDLETERLSVLRARSLDPGEVLLSLRGSPIRAAVMPEGMQSCVASPNIAILTLKNPKMFTNGAGLDSYYLAGLLNSEYMSQTLSTYFSGGAVPSLSVRTLRGLKVPVPPPEIQREFAEAFKAHNRTLVNTQKLLTAQKDRLEAELNQQLGEIHA